jgi:hypothetical protein
MSPDGQMPQGWEELMRSIMREVSRTVDDRVSQGDIEEIAETVGIDPAFARQWAESAGEWLRQQADVLGEEGSPGQSRPPVPGVGRDVLADAGPHPLDLPTADQGLALAALESGRWTVESGSDALMGHGEGPGPSDALGLVRELRARDWIGVDGKVTLVGRNALSRWLAAE